jgi:hypothetical protein
VIDSTKIVVNIPGLPYKELLRKETVIGSWHVDNVTITKVHKGWTVVVALVERYLGIGKTLDNGRLDSAGLKARVRSIGTTWLVIHWHIDWVVHSLLSFDTNNIKKAIMIVNKKRNNNKIK